MSILLLPFLFVTERKTLVGSSRLELPTSRLSGARSNLLSYEPIRYVPRYPLHHALTHGGDDGIRTHDPLLAGQVLSQLSYTPIGVSPVSGIFPFLEWSFKIEQQFDRCFVISPYFLGFFYSENLLTCLSLTVGSP